MVGSLSLEEDARERPSFLSKIFPGKLRTLALSLLILVVLAGTLAQHVHYGTPEVQSHVQPTLANFDE